jgi:hypothetical protein
LHGSSCTQRLSSAQSMHVTSTSSAAFETVSALILAFAALSSSSDVFWTLVMVCILPSRSPMDSLCAVSRAMALEVKALIAAASFWSARSSASWRRTSQAAWVRSSRFILSSSSLLSSSLCFFSASMDRCSSWPGPLCAGFGRPVSAAFRFFSRGGAGGPAPRGACGPGRGAPVSALAWSACLAGADRFGHSS